MTVTLDDLREHVGEGPSDEDLQRALDAALEAIENRYGPDADSYTEYLTPFGQWVRLGRRASEVSSVTEGDDALEDTDYVLWPDSGGRYVRRIRDDLPTRWEARRIEVNYVPLSESAERDRITIELCDASLNSVGADGLTSITVGPWSESYGDAGSAQESREASLNSLRPASPSIW